MINSDILEDVSLLNGGYAQRSGNRTGAEVDFRLREGSRERPQARVAVSGTSASLVVEGPLGGAQRGSWLVSARQSYLDLVIDRLDDEGEGVNFGFSDAQAKVVFDLTPSQRAELTVLAGRSSSRSPRRAGRRRSLPRTQRLGDRDRQMAAGRRRAACSARARSRRLNRFSNDTTDRHDLDEGPRRAGGGRFDASISVAAAACSSRPARRSKWTDETRMRQRFTVGDAIASINDFPASAHALRRLRAAAMDRRAR